MNNSAPPRLLTDYELSRLLAPVPLVQQQRNAPVSVRLRPGLPADYVGPVELADLRLSLSPWHWLRQELAIIPATAALNQKWAQERADAGFEGGTLEEIGTWLYAEKFSSDDENNLYAAIIPGDSMEWGHYGVVSDRDGHFLPPAFDLRVVMFFADESMSDGIVVVQTVWEGPETAKVTGPISIFAMPSASHQQWLHNTDELWLSDFSTGETFKLEFGGNEEDSETPGDWVGATPTLDRYKFASADQDSSALPTVLRYEAGRLYRPNTNALLTLGLPRSESASA